MMWSRRSYLWWYDTMVEEFWCVGDYRRWWGRNMQIM